MQLAQSCAAARLLGCSPGRSSSSRPGQRRPCRPAAAAGRAAGPSTPQQQDAASLDVSGAVVKPSFRSTPWEDQEAVGGSTAARTTARIALVSESGVCRNVLAAAALTRVLQQRGLAGSFELECRASRDYCLGQGPDAAAAAVAAELGWQLPTGYQAQQFKEARDIVFFDLVLVVDKFVAADVLREVSVFDTIQTWGKAQYTSKVRRLGEFLPSSGGRGSSSSGAANADLDATDIEDPLYGNVGEEGEVAAVRSAAAAIQLSCDGLADFLAGVQQRHREAQQAQHDGGAEGSAAQMGLGDALAAAVREMGEMDWLVPPMLAPR